MDNAEPLSLRPYLIRAIHDWCIDKGYTPYVAVAVDDTVMVPRAYVKNNEIVLNVSFDATNALYLGDEHIEFKARFSGVVHELLVPVHRVMAIYARENGQGMAFTVIPSENLAPKTAAAALSADIAKATGAAVVSTLPSAGKRSRKPQLVSVDSVKKACAPKDKEESGEDPPPSRPTPTTTLKRVK